MVALDELRFDNRFTASLPGENAGGTVPRQVAGACYSRVSPTPVTRPTLVAHSSEVCELLGLTSEELQDTNFADVFSGNRLLKGMDSHATCYGGHQFGNWAGQLGDGRAIALGEVIDVNGDHQMLQLKGAGPTPYSRSADGLAVLRSSIREFLCSEAMHHLRVPTTRALSLVITGDQVVRDVLYDGNPAPEPGAIVCRVAPSFIRFGNFEIFAARGDLTTLKKLADFVLRTEFPHIETGTPESYVELLKEVGERTADMVAEWLRVGFVHGVMNTDNMSILGLTIDYGPYGCLDNYDPNWTPNTTDFQHRRYRYGNQPSVAQWNLVQLANALYPLVEEVEPLQEAIANYTSRFEMVWSKMLAAKLGLQNLDDNKDKSLAKDVLSVLQTVETDMTIFWRELAKVDLTATADKLERSQPLMNAVYQPGSMTSDQRASFVEFADN
ncbi:MAG: YdiU family protein, partial [Acidimicrobiales bacterium]|nr:YdiU family protein [Acidimicrobiales bacterium]